MVDQKAQSEDKKKHKDVVYQLKRLLNFSHNILSCVIIIMVISTFIIVIFLFLTILLTYRMIYLKFLELFELNNNREMEIDFICGLVDIIEFVFLAIMLLMLTLGMYNYIIQPLLKNGIDSTTNDLFKDFATHLSQPFLIIISSMLVVYSIKFIFKIFYEVDNYSYADPFDSIIQCAIIISLVFFIIIIIGILMRIEKSIIHDDKS